MEDEPINQNYLIGCDTIENSPSLYCGWWMVSSALSGRQATTALPEFGTALPQLVNVKLGKVSK